MLHEMDLGVGNNLEDDVEIIEIRRRHEMFATRTLGTRPWNTPIIDGEQFIARGNPKSYMGWDL